MTPKTKTLNLTEPELRHLIGCYDGKPLDELSRDERRALEGKLFTALAGFNGVNLSDIVAKVRADVKAKNS